MANTGGKKGDLEKHEKAKDARKATMKRKVRKANEMKRGVGRIVKAYNKGSDTKAGLRSSTKEALADIAWSLVRRITKEVENINNLDTEAGHGRKTIGPAQVRRAFTGMAFPSEVRRLAAAHGLRASEVYKQSFQT